MPGEGGRAREQLGIKTWIRIIFVCSLPAAVLDWENKQVSPGQTQDRFYGLLTKFVRDGGESSWANWHQGRRNWAKFPIVNWIRVERRVK